MNAHNYSTRRHIHNKCTYQPSDVVLENVVQPKSLSSQGNLDSTPWLRIGDNQRLTNGYQWLISGYQCG